MIYVSISLFTIMRQTSHCKVNRVASREVNIGSCNDKL